MVQCLEKLKGYDAEVLAAIEEAIAIVGQDAAVPAVANS
jgi:hypothetical protein